MGGMALQASLEVARMGFKCNMNDLMDSFRYLFQVISQVNETEFRKMENTLEEAEEKLHSVSEKKAQ